MHVIAFDKNGEEQFRIKFSEGLYNDTNQSQENLLDGASSKSKVKGKKTQPPHPSVPK